MSNARLFIVSGPSGSGKGTLLAELRSRHPDIFYSVSATTRAPRVGLEEDGVHYYFLTREKFEEMIANGEFIEYNAYCDQLYGTPRRPVEEALKSGRSVVLEIETAGMRDVFRQYPDAVTVFIEPPSPEVLEQRLKGRNSEDEEKCRKRLEKAKAEMALADRYRYRVVNDDLSRASRELESIYLEATR